MAAETSLPARGLKRKNILKTYSKKKALKTNTAAGNARERDRTEDGGEQLDKGEEEEEVEEDEEAEEEEAEDSQNEAIQDNAPDEVIVGLDFGTAFSAMFISTPDGRRIPIGNYPKAPPSLAGRPEDIHEVPSVVTLRRNPRVEYEYGNEATHDSSYRFTNIKALIEGDAAESSRLKALLDKFNRGLAVPITKEHLIQGFLKYLRIHLLEECKKLKLPAPSLVIATHPVAWSAESVILFTNMLRGTGWARVETLTEPEAAVDVLLRDQPSSFFDECGTRICVVDLGGMTDDRAFYRVRKSKGRLIKEELIQSVGAYGGMALADRIVRDIIELARGDLSKDDIDYLCQQFSLAKMSFDPQTSVSLTLGRGTCSYTLDGDQLLNIYDVALQPIVDTTLNLRRTLEKYDIESVFLVGGTSMSTWLWPDLSEAFGDVVQIYRPSRTLSTLVAEGATMAWSPDSLTQSRISSLSLGHLVSQSYNSNLFRDHSLWGTPKEDYDGKIVIECVEMIKQKGDELQDFSSADWHWCKLPTATAEDFERVLLSTYVQVFATGSDELTICHHPSYYDTCPVTQFNLTIEQRHVFNEVDIHDLHTTIFKRQRSRKTPFMYALRFVTNGLGLNLHAAWTEKLTRIGPASYSKLRIKDLGGVKFIIR